MAVAPSPSEHLFNPSADTDPLGGRPCWAPGRWPWSAVEQLRGGVRPWGSFLDGRRFGAPPRSLGELGQRLQRNGAAFAHNYLCVFLGLLLYCLVTSPLLLLALGGFSAACYFIRQRAQQAPLVILGRELGPSPQLGLAGLLTLPLLWVAGAGAAVFWVLGVTVAVIGSHAALRQPEPPETPPLQMEPV